MPRPLVFLFPGQNSRYPAMLEAVAGDGESRRWIERASDILGRDLLRHFRAGNPDIFARNRDVQIGVFLANHLHWQRLERAGLRARFSAGLSLGEFNHLVHIGALDFDDAIALLEMRGAAYERGPAGRMAAVFPAVAEEIAPLVADLGLGEQFGIAMVNSPRQIVLSGEANAVDAATERLADALGCGSVVIEPAIPMHSPLFRPVATVFRPALESARWHTPRLPYISNVSGRIETVTSPSAFVDALARHVCSTVRWRDCIDAVAAAVGDATFVESGPGAVLTGLFGRKWHSPRRVASDAAGGSAAFTRLVEEGSGGVLPAAGAY